MAKKGKTKKSVAKRFKLKKSGKILMQKACRKHLLSSKSKRQLRKPGALTVSPGRAKSIKAMLGA